MDLIYLLVYGWRIRQIVVKTVVRDEISKTPWCRTVGNGVIFNQNDAADFGLFFAKVQIKRFGYNSCMAT